MTYFADFQIFNLKFNELLVKMTTINKRLLIFTFLFIVLTPYNASAVWPFKCKLNQYDALGRRQGKWVAWWDEEKKIPMNIEHYKDGRERGRCRHFYMDGTKRLQFNAHKDGRMKVKYYTETGQLEKKGWSLMIYTPEEIRYTWNGIWKFYENGKCIRKVEYKMGDEVTIPE